MSLQSDVSINAERFLASSITEETHKLNSIVEGLSNGPKWYDVGAAKYRQMWEEGKTSLPKPTYLNEAEDDAVPSRETGRDIPIRVYRPQNGRQVKGIFIHMHGGGFVLGSHKMSDLTLQRYANECGLIGISIGYRLAPEHSFPAGLEDCFDAAEHLFDHAETKYGTKTIFMGGESAGCCLAAATTFQLMRSRPQLPLAGLLFTFGQFDLTLSSPSVSLSRRPLVINAESMAHFAEAYAPGTSMEERKDPLMSPLFDDLQALADASSTRRLPPALFIVGSIDPLLDDTLLMSVKWMMTGSKAVVKVFPGLPHGFTSMPCKEAGEAATVQIQFVQRVIQR